MNARFLCGLAAVLALSVPGSTVWAGPGHPPCSEKTTCAGGEIAPGIYNDVTVTGTCTIKGDVTINGNVKIEDGAYLDAAYLTTQLTINGNVSVGKKAILGLGCSFGYHDCGFSGTWLGAVNVNGNIKTKDSLTMYLDFVTVHGNVEWKGGGDISLVDHPPVEDGLVLAIKDNVINGNLKVDGWEGAWFGVIRNMVYGNVTVTKTVGTRLDSTETFLDSTEIVTNTITGNLNCRDNAPPAQIGDSGGSPNTVGGKKSGECASL
jgi:hypothetical protein